MTIWYNQQVTEICFELNTHRTRICVIGDVKQYKLIQAIYTYREIET